MWQALRNEVATRDAHHFVYPVCPKFVRTVRATLCALRATGVDRSNDGALCWSHPALQARLTDDWITKFYLCRPAPPYAGIAELHQVFVGVPNRQFGFYYRI